MKKEFLFSITLISIVILIFSFGLYKFHNNNEKEKLFYKTTIDNCVRDVNSNIYCKEMNYDAWNEEYNSFFIKPTVPLLFEYVVLDTSLLDLMPFFIGISISFISILNIYKIVKSRIFKYYLYRKSYTNLLKSNYIKSLSYSLIFPLIIIIVLLLISVYCGFKWQYLPGEQEFATHIGGYFFSDNIMLRERCYEYFVIMIISSIFIGIYYINMAYLSFYKTKNFVINGIFLIFIIFFVEVVLSILMGGFISVFTHSFNPYGLNSAILFVFSDYSLKWDFLLYSILKAFITGILVFYFYCQKERFISNNE